MDPAITNVASASASNSFPAGLSPAKHYGNDSAKELSRGLVQDSIRKHILLGRDPSRIRCLCLPGIDIMDIRSIFDPLNIPRINITGVERDPENAQVIRDKGSGIQIVEGDVCDYLRSLKAPSFDVVLLDFTGPMHPDHINALHYLARNNSASRFLVQYSTSTRRDPYAHGLIATGGDVYGKSFAQSMQSATDTDAMFRALIEDKSKSMHVFRSHKEDGKNLKQLRSSAITNAVYAALCESTTAEDLTKIWDRVFPSGSVFSLDRFIAHLQERAAPSPQLMLSRDKIEWASSDYSTWGMLLDRLLMRLGERSGLALTGAAVIPLVSRVAQSEKCLHFAVAIDRYSYVSESGCPMSGDIVVVERNRGVIAAAQRIAEALSGKSSFRSIDRDFQTIINQAAYSGQLWATARESERKYLGRSGFSRASEESERVVVADESEASHIGENADVSLPDETQGRDSKLPVESLVPTMGAAPKELTKDDALDLLAANIPISEILAAYPGEFTDHQLRAYKAHLTMGTYKR